MEYLKTFVILAVFLILSVACVLNIIRHRKEDKEAKAEKKRRRSPFAPGGELDSKRASETESADDYNNAYNDDNDKDAV